MCLGFKERFDWTGTDMNIDYMNKVSQLLKRFHFIQNQILNSLIQQIRAESSVFRNATVENFLYKWRKLWTVGLLPASEECRHVVASSCCLLLNLLLNHSISFHKSWIFFFF